MTTDELRQWLALTLLPGLNLPQFKNLDALLASTRRGQTLTEETALAAGFTSAFWLELQNILQGKMADDVKRQLDMCVEWAEKPNHHLLAFSAPAYPPLLHETAEPPPVLFVRGHPEVLALPQLGIVGSRKPTADGRRNARRFAAELVAAGYQITSGLALGIDAESHAGALENQGVTLAVLGTGLNTIYPTQNTKLAAMIAERGALVSEFMPDIGPAPWHFPLRNRVISGLSHGVLVVEAAQRSGSLITARLAAEQGREVFAIPGSIHNTMVRGCHQLIRQGAKLVETVADVLEELPTLLAWEKSRNDSAADNDSPDKSRRVGKQARRVLEHIAYNPVSVDVLVRSTGLELSLLYTCLMELELKGIIEVQNGAYVLSPA